MQHAAFEAFSGQCVCRRYISSPTWWNSTFYIFGIETFSFFYQFKKLLGNPGTRVFAFGKPSRYEDRHSFGDMGFDTKLEFVWGGVGLL